MQDIGTFYEGKLIESQERRSRHRRNSAKLLSRNGIPHVCHNIHSDGTAIHIVIGERIDFYPGTGKWKDRYSGETGRGVFQVMKYYRKVKE